MRVLLLLTTLIFTTAAMAQEQKESNPMIAIHTNHGVIKVELYSDKAPKSVENFLQYARDGFYANTIFHRVISDFMIQGGGFSPDMQQLPTRSPIVNEADNGLSNARGTLAMARTPAPDSATAQFFINVQDNTFLDHKGKHSPQAWGYAVFGKVVEGMDVVDDIRFVDTQNSGMHQNVPVEPVIIERVEILDGDAE
ncbi:MAG: peptidylprolyl isomerase B [Wenzhouxiangellaceae bacterium]